ncbi:MAG: type II secretion system protein M [Gammaproteobacteria bacterium]|nr:type II secretion system protein M [Gammaproteobacteria bacterium]MBU6508708.1 type II secretion system protein M [Gammaproteobacteria bacterium]MDE1982937.1 type II secretion system protein M [Gammaproteobacteria bacterium]MDE2108683.1 type II secretion system protein M [Gammaproteobacteria bacterium]MDE2459671.1 type II secretion system protein M [Gammaproteobacteria bacterium]
MNALQQLRQWFLSLEKRERGMVACGAAILVIFIVYLALVAPYLSHRRALITQVQSQQALLAWMRPVASQIEALHGSQPAVPTAGSLLGTVNASIASAGLAGALQQAQPSDDGSVRVQFKSADFGSLVSWIAGLQRSYGVVASDVTVTRASVAGQVDARIKLQDSSS